MPAGWTLDGELQKLGRHTETAEVLSAVGLLDRPEEPFELRVDFDWVRGGAETYIYGFSVVRPTEVTRHLMKACVAWGSGSLGDIFQTWLRRRELLAGIGLSVPCLHLHDAAALVEEYIEHGFFEHTAVAMSEQRSRLLGQAGYAAGRLSGAGFLPISLADWRSRGDDVVIVDFGQDLGDPGASEDPGLVTLSEVVTNLEAAGCTLERGELRALEDGFALGLG